MENVVEGARIEGPKGRHLTRVAGASGSAVEVVAGLVAVVLSILGLAGRIVVPFASIAMIAAGAALLFEAAAVGAREADHRLAGDPVDRASVRSAIGADAIAGMVAVVLGVLGLVGIEPITLLPVGAVILGAGLLLSSAGPTADRGRGQATEDLVHDSLTASAGIHVLVGAGAVVLGVIGLLGSTPILMTLIATLSIGAAQLLTGASIGARVMTTHRHDHGPSTMPV